MTQPSGSVRGEVLERPATRHATTKPPLSDEQIHEQRIALRLSIAAIVLTIGSVAACYVSEKSEPARPNKSGINSYVQPAPF